MMKRRVEVLAVTTETGQVARPNREEAPDEARMRRRPAPQLQIQWLTTVVDGDNTLMQSHRGAHLRVNGGKLSKSLAL